MKPAVLVVGILALGLLNLTTSGREVRRARASGDLHSPVTHKVVAPPGLLPAGEPGVELLQDYGSYILYRISEAVLAGLPAELRDQVRVVDEMDRILLDSISPGPQMETLNLTEKLALPQGDAGLELVQFVGPIKPEWLEAVKATGGQPIHYIANNAYLVWVEADSRSRFAELSRRVDFIQFSAAYQAGIKLGRSLKALLEEPDGQDQPVVVTVQMVRHAGQAASEGAIAALSLAELTPWTPVLEFQNRVIQVRRGDLPALAALPEVTWIGERLKRELFDEVQGQILASSLTGNATAAGPGYLAWLQSLGFSQDPADYPVVDITDDGIGDGSLDSGDPTLHTTGQAAGPTRLAYLLNCTTEADAGSQNGHGHLNASIAAGYDDRAGFPFQDLSGYNLGLGINPFGRLGGTRVFTTVYDAVSCGNSDAGVIAASAAAGAGISSNSWGCSDCSAIYDDSSQVYDAGVRDADPARPGNQAVAFVFAAGNGGRLGETTVGSPGNAKNVITVGASEGYRPDWTDGCSVGPSGADNGMDLAPFSSRGPAPGGRTKPDLVAPGTHIQGTASPHAGYTGSGLCDAYRPDGQVLFTASSGTSHAAPAVAGMLSLYTYWLEHTYNLPSPSPALLKAYALAHTTYLTGAGAGGDLPGNSQGYGLPDLSAAFDGAARYLLDQAVVLDRSGETWRFNGAAADPTRPVRIVLAYTDQPGMIGSSPQVNDLNLKVTAGGETYLGNHFSAAWSTPGGEPDPANNVEAVYLPAGSWGDLDITITGFNIAGDGIPNSGDASDQDFALVCYNCVEVLRQEVCAPQDALYLIPVKQLPGETGPVVLSAGGLPDGVAAEFKPNPVLPPGNSLLRVRGTAAAAPSKYTLEVTGTVQGSTYLIASVEMSVFAAPPGVPTPVMPAFAAVDQPPRPAFEWFPAAFPSAYTVEIAGDPTFTQAALTAAGLDGNTYTPFSDLEPARLYYWRVQAVNPCGASGYSPPAVFGTPPSPGECSLGYSPELIYAEGFENGAAGWSHAGWADSWTLTSQRQREGDWSFRSLDPPWISDQWLFSPALALPAGISPLTFRFWNYQSIEHRSASSCYDGATLEISRDGGLAWTQVPPASLLTDPYDGPVRSSSNLLNGQEAWCGDPQDWQNAIVGLDAYGGETVRFRFRLGSDSSVGREGWYIDDVSIQGCRPSGGLALLGPESSIQALPGERVVHVFILRNLGVDEMYHLTISEGRWPSAMLIPAEQRLAAGERLEVPVEVIVPEFALEEAGEPDLFNLAAAPAADPARAIRTTGRTAVSSHAGVSLSWEQALTAAPGSSAVYAFTVKNTGNLVDNFTFAAYSAWQFELSAPAVGPLAPGEEATVFLAVSVPAGAAFGEWNTTVLRVTSTLDESFHREAYLTTHVGLHQLLFPFIGRR